MSYTLDDIIHKFAIKANISPYGNGHINDTYIAESNPRFIMQKINSNVFKNPYEVMQNIVNVTEHLKKKIAENGGDTERETLSVVLSLIHI